MLMLRMASPYDLCLLRWEVGGFCSILGERGVRCIGLEEKEDARGEHGLNGGLVGGRFVSA
jgi:hypothetical protein